ncbi:MAG: glycoside hydrolase [Verrucomicrobia bacterium]|nr:glycoside hydrolase [Verrucomicrobiota bacterium]
MLLAATGLMASPLALSAPARRGPAEPKLGPNLRLGEDPSTLPAARRAQAEPHVARSFTDPNLLVAIFQEGRFEDGGAVNCGYAISHDGGTTWERGLIPHLIASLDGGPFERASDPVAGVDLAGTIYLNTLGINRRAQGLHPTIVLTKSLDGGRTFSAPLTVVTSTTASVMLDKNWMAVNTFPATPQAGRLAVTYTRFETLEGSQFTPIAVTLSDDGGGDLDPANRGQPTALPGLAAGVSPGRLAGHRVLEFRRAVGSPAGSCPLPGRRRHICAPASDRSCSAL